MWKIFFRNEKQLTNDLKILWVRNSCSFTWVCDLSLFKSYITNIQYNWQYFEDSVDFILVKVKLKLFFNLLIFLLIWKTWDWVDTGMIEVIVIRSTIFKLVQTFLWRRSSFDKVVKNVVVSLSLWHTNYSAFLQKIRYYKCTFYLNLSLSIHQQNQFPKTRWIVISYCFRITKRF